MREICTSGSAGGFRRRRKPAAVPTPIPTTPSFRPRFPHHDDTKIPCWRHALSLSQTATTRRVTHRLSWTKSVHDCRVVARAVLRPGSARGTLRPQEEECRSRASSAMNTASRTLTSTRSACHQSTSRLQHRRSTSPRP